MMPRLVPCSVTLALVLFTAACGQTQPSSSDAATADSVQPAASDADLSGLVGLSGTAGESRLADLGYQSVGGRNEDNASITYWRRTSDASCVMVRTVEGSYASVAPAAADECAAAEAATTAVAEADAGGYRTVCGVIVDGSPVRYVCSVVGGDQRVDPTTLRFPDQVMTLHWLEENRVRIEIEGLNPIEGTWSESEGETDLVTPGQTWFYISNREAAAFEVQSMEQ